MFITSNSPEHKQFYSVFASYNEKQIEKITSFLEQKNKKILTKMPHCHSIVERDNKYYLLAPTKGGCEYLKLTKKFVEEIKDKE